MHRSVGELMELKKTALFRGPLLLAFVACASGVYSQELSKRSWEKAAVERLRSIYERGEYRSKRFDGKWLSDSSGYYRTERAGETGEMTTIFLERDSGRHFSPEDQRDRIPKENRDVSPDGQRVLEVRDRQLFVREIDGGRRVPLTKPVGAREVFFRQRMWSPDGRSILFVQSDESSLRIRSMLLPVDPSYPKVVSQRFARVGERIPELRIGVVSPAGDRLVWLPLDSPPDGFYVGQVAWAGNSEEVLVEKLSRFRDRREFLLIDIQTGATTTIFEETNAAWSVSSQNKNSGLIWVHDGKEFVVMSEKDGWRHAFLYSRAGKELCVLTPGKYDIIDRCVINERSGHFYFYASPENPAQKYLYRVPLDGSGQLERVTPETQPGTHDYDFSPDRRWAFHTRSSFDKPPVTDLLEMPSHRVVRVLEDNDHLAKKMVGIISVPTEFVTLDISDEVSLDAWILKPSTFDPSRRYPVLVYVYGEPHSQTVLDEWGTHHVDFHRLIADLGFVVVSIDNRGTPSPKGANWRRSVFGSLGPLSTEDQAAGLKELGRARPYLDLNRVAIWGWSGGGSNTLNALFRKPDVYQVGIAVVPKPQPELYNAWFQEIYMRTVEVNREGYRRSAPINFAEGLAGRLLIVTGSGETNTHIQIVEGLVNRLIELGKPFDYMVYPNRDHGLREGRGTAVHLRMLMARYLVEHLKPDAAMRSESGE